VRTSPLATLSRVADLLTGRLRSFVALSLLLGCSLAAATRPHFGGRLRVEYQAAPVSLDPSDADPFTAEAAVVDDTARLLFDRLVVIDAAGRPQPALARAWDVDAAGREWQFHLRPGVRLSDGGLLTPPEVTASLSRTLLLAFPDATVDATRDGVRVVLSSPRPDLLWELGRLRQSIVLPGPAGRWRGTGPFALTDWQVGRHMALAANQHYWGGRPYLDGLDIRLGVPAREQTTDLALDRADRIEIPVEEIRAAQQRGLQVLISGPRELVALLLVAGRPATESDAVRAALVHSLDRNALWASLAQREGAPAAGLLPQWMSGTAFLFTNDVATGGQGGQITAASPVNSASVPVVLAYDRSDPLSRALAERIAVNARDAGLAVRPQAENMAARSGDFDVILVRTGLESASPGASLAALVSILPGTAPAPPAAVTAAAIVERQLAVLATHRVIPLLHVPRAYAESARVHAAPDSGTTLNDLWVSAP